MVPETRLTPAKLSIKETFAELGETVRNMRKYSEIVKFLIARVIFNDGLGTIFAFGGIYAAGTFGMTMSEIIVKIPGCRPLDAGELSNAMAIEAFTAVMLQLNIRYKTRVAPKLTGIKGDPRAWPARMVSSDGVILCVPCVSSSTRF